MKIVDAGARTDMSAFPALFNDLKHSLNGVPNELHMSMQIGDLPRTHVAAETVRAASELLSLAAARADVVAALLEGKARATPPHAQGLLRAADEVRTAASLLTAKADKAANESTMPSMTLTGLLATSARAGRAVQAAQNTFHSTTGEPVWPLAGASHEFGADGAGHELANYYLRRAAGQPT